MENAGGDDSLSVMPMNILLGWWPAIDSRSTGSQESAKGQWNYDSAVTELLGQWNSSCWIEEINPEYFENLLGLS